MKHSTSHMLSSFGWLACTVFAAYGPYPWVVIIAAILFFVFAYLFIRANKKEAANRRNFRNEKQS